MGMIALAFLIFCLFLWAYVIFSSHEVIEYVEKRKEETTGEYYEIEPHDRK